MSNKKNSRPFPAAAMTDTADLYIRVSTAEQADEGYSVGEQEERLRNYCSAMGIPVHAVHTDPGISGATLDRPGIRQVISDVETGRCSKVIVWKLDRLSRSQKDTLVLLEDVFLANGCSFVSLMESFDTSTPFGRCIVGILAAFAQMERENIKARTMMGKLARIKEGHFHGSHAPVGYRFQTSQDGALISNDLSVDPYAAGLVREVFRLFLSGWSISRISGHMAETYGSQLYEWGRNTAVRRILSNPVYMGRVKAGDEWCDGIHEAIVSESDWHAAAAMLAHNKALDKRSYTYKLPGGYAADNLLTGLLFCGDCGARMYARKISRSNHVKRYMCHSVARTSAAMIRSDHCTNRLHPFTVSEVDEIILGEIMKLALDRSCFEAAASRRMKPAAEDTSVYTSRLTEVNNQVKRLLNLYQTGLIDLDEVKDRLSSLNREKTQLEARISSMEDLQTEAEIRETAWKAAQSLHAVLEEGNMEEVHSIVHSLIDKVVILNDDITIYWSFS